MINRRIIKHLALISIIALVLCGVFVLGHSHEGDPLHLAHQNCLIFQLETSFQSAEVLVWAWIIYLAVSFTPATASSFTPIRQVYCRVFGRAPPVCLHYLGK